MKSLSRHFPVRYHSAESFTRHNEDIYLLKPNNSPDKTVELALCQLSLSKPVESVSAPPIILVHEAFQNRRQFIDQQGQGLAGDLLVQGRAVWLLEWRGHGASPLNRQDSVNTLEQIGRYDFAPACRFVSERSGQKPIWLGLNEGAEALAWAQALGALHPDNSDKILWLGRVFPPRSRALQPLVPNVFKHRGRNGLVAVKARGPELESRALLLERERQQGWRARPGSHRHVSLIEQLASSALPLRYLHAELSIAQQRYFPVGGWPALRRYPLPGCEDLIKHYKYSREALLACLRQALEE